MMNSQCISKLNICFQRLQRLFERPSLPATQHYHVFSFLLSQTSFFFLSLSSSSFIISPPSFLIGCPISLSAKFSHFTERRHRYTRMNLWSSIMWRFSTITSPFLFSTGMQGCKSTSFLFLFCVWGMIGQGRERRFFKDPWGCLSPTPEPVPEREGTLISWMDVHGWQMIAEEGRRNPNQIKNQKDETHTHNKQIYIHTILLSVSRQKVGR